jgi:hypothetical protein
LGGVGHRPSYSVGALRCGHLGVVHHSTTFNIPYHRSSIHFVLLHQIIYKRGCTDERDCVVLSQSFRFRRAKANQLYVNPELKGQKQCHKVGLRLDIHRSLDENEKLEGIRQRTL